MRSIDGDISNDLDGPLIWFSRSRHFWRRIFKTRDKSFRDKVTKEH